MTIPPSWCISGQMILSNPKAGIVSAAYTHQGWAGPFLSYSLASHEPSRDDFETGANDQPRPEMLHDFELSLQKKDSRYSWGATAYYMLYHDFSLES